MDLFAAMERLRRAYRTEQRPVHSGAGQNSGRSSQLGRTERQPVHSWAGQSSGQFTAGPDRAAASSQRGRTEQPPQLSPLSYGKISKERTVPQVRRFFPYLLLTLRRQARMTFTHLQRVCAGAAAGGCMNTLFVLLISMAPFKWVYTYFLNFIVFSEEQQGR